MTYDVVIRNGAVIDGTGLSRFRADVAVKNGRIAEIGNVRAGGKEEIDASRHVVTPGFIDAHTHMDAQVNWDPLGTSSCWHGVTTVVMGNCGFSLAPVRPDERAYVVKNLERAEDISPAAMNEGIRWSWSTFPEYLDAVEKLPKGINYAAYVGHSALRTWAMGARAFAEAASPADLELMAGQLADALKAGAMGLSTSRSNAHETPDNKPVASRMAAWSEIELLVNRMGELGTGVFEIAQEEDARVKDPVRRANFFGRIRKLALESRVPISFSVTLGCETPEAWHEQLALLDEVAEKGGRIIGQTHSRGGASVLLSFQTQMPFDKLPEWRALRSQSRERQMQILREPESRKKLIHAANHGDYGRAVGAEARKPDYDLLLIYDKALPPYRTVAEVAKERGCDPVEVVIDEALASNMERFFIQNRNVYGTEDTLAIMRHPRTVMTFSDSGAHVSQIVDASIQTVLLAYWVRELQAFSLEEAVRMLTLAPAVSWGFASERGQLREGMVADINVFDPVTLGPRMPEVVNDLPAGETRLIQRSTGFLATIVGGQILLRNGVHTGALPGRLLRNRLASRTP